VSDDTFTFTDAPAIDEEITPRPAGSQIPPGVKDAGKKAGGIFGNNRRARGGPRRTKPGELVEPLTNYYMTLALFLTPVKPDVAMSIMAPVVVGIEDDGVTGVTKTRAQVCAEAWDELAQENDAVRRAVLWLIEGGKWGAVFMANLPILMAAFPAAMPSFLNFGQNGQGEATNVFSFPNMDHTEG